MTPMVVNKTGYLTPMMVLKTGFLEKKGEWSGVWNERYVTLHAGGILSLFDNQHSTDPRWIYMLNGAKVIYEGKHLTLIIGGKKIRFRARAPDAKKLIEDWVKQIEQTAAAVNCVRPACVRRLGSVHDAPGASQRADDEFKTLMMPETLGDHAHEVVVPPNAMPGDILCVTVGVEASNRVMVPRRYRITVPNGAEPDTVLVFDAAPCDIPAYVDGCCSYLWSKLGGRVCPIVSNGV